MFDVETIARLRAILDDVCRNVSCHETGVRAHVATKILEAAASGEISVESLTQIGREALSVAHQSAAR